jgi:hypothetical protein
VEEVLEANGISQDKILDAKGEYYNIPTQNLEGKDVPFSILKYVSEDAATHYNFVPLTLKDGVLEIGIIDPENIEARDAINFIVNKLGVPYKIFIISEKDYKRIVGTYKGLSGEVTKALNELETELSEDLENIEILSDKEKDKDKKLKQKLLKMLLLRKSLRRY